jgi:fucose permease
LSVSLYLLYTGVEGTTGLWANSVLVERRGVPTTTAGLWVAGYFGAIMVGRVLVGLVSERWNNRRLAAGGLYLCGAGAICFSWPGPAELALVGLLLLGLGAAPVYPCLMHETPRRFTALDAPVVIGRQVGSAYVGAAFLPGLIGWLAAQFGLQLIGPLVATLVVLLLAVLHRLNRLT